MISCTLQGYLLTNWSALTGTPCLNSTALKCKSSSCFYLGPWDSNPRQILKTIFLDGLYKLYFSNIPCAIPNHSEELEIGHELQSVQELQSMLENLELQLEAGRENPSGSGSAEQPPNESQEQRQEQAAEPWLLPQFRTIQRSSKDQWNFTLWDQGWAIREHRKHRVRAFHPVHSSTPFDCAILDSERVTRKVCPREEIVTDQWTAASTWRGEAWNGIHIFSAECRM